MLTKWCSRSRLSKGYNEREIGGSLSYACKCKSAIIGYVFFAIIFIFIFIYLFLFSCFLSINHPVHFKYHRFFSLSFFFRSYFFLLHFLSIFFSEMSILRKNSNDQSEVRICENWASPIFHLYRIDQSATSVGTKRLIGASIKVEDRSKMATLFAMAPFLCLSRIVFFSLAFRLFLSR